MPEAQSKILICTHKDFISPKSNLYLPIIVGRVYNDFKSNFQGDNIGDNISSKNINYCELTGLYWAWKNLDNLDYIGLCHYRRYFVSSRFLKFFIKYISFNYNELFSLEGAIKVDQTVLGHYDFILPEPINLGMSIYDDYGFHCSKLDFDILGEIIKELDNDYFDSFNKLFHNSSQLSPYNMLFTSKINFDNYCNWLFTILFEVEKRINISSDAYQARVFGFLAERLLNLYIYHNGFKVKYLPVTLIEETKKEIPVLKSILKFIIRIIHNILNKIINLLTK
jgi:hypothetical protein